MRFSLTCGLREGIQIPISAHDYTDLLKNIVYVDRYMRMGAAFPSVLNEGPSIRLQMAIPRSPKVLK